MFQARPDERRNSEPVIKPSPRTGQQPFHNLVVVVMGMAMVLISTWPLAVRTS
jgi:hypothetical protein